MTDDQGLNAYIQAAQAEATAEVCSRHISGFAAEFERRYQAWRQANIEALSKGATLAESRGMTGDKPPSVKSFARFGAQILEEIPADDRQRRCNELLSLLIETKSQ